MNEQKVILFDGDCNLCARSVKFIERHDSGNVFRPVALKSAEGRRYAETLNLKVDDPHSVILFDGKMVSQKSKAGIQILESMKSTRRAGRMIGLMPRWLTDLVYDLVARHRYLLFGKRTRA